MHMRNMLLAPATKQLGSDHLKNTHFRAMHLVLGLAELFVHYARQATAKEIYEAFLNNDIIIGKRKRQPGPRRVRRW